MKKILGIFLLTQILYASNLYAVTNTAIPATLFVNVTSIISSHGSFDTDTYMGFGNCNRKSYYMGRSDEYLYTNNISTGKPYLADEDNGCKNGIRVCVHGPSIVKTTTYKNRCWISDCPYGAFSDDSWQAKETISECSPTSLEPWTKNSSRKISVFVTTTNKIMSADDDGKKLVKSLIGDDPITNYHIQCVAYICKHDDGKYSYGCPDGSCPEIGDECPDTGPEDPGSGDPGSGSGGSTPPPEESDVVHRNTVQPYLDALKIKCPSVGK